MSEEAAPPARRRLGLGFWSFVVLMLGLTGLWIGLGVWQLDRLTEKEALVAEVAARLERPPFELPPAEQWGGLDLETYGFHPLTATGRYLSDKTVLVFTSLTEPRGKFSGPGYWVMTPLETGGGIVFVNRGFIPQSSAAAFGSGQSGPQGVQTVTGVALAPEATGPFTPGPDNANHIEWVRDPVRLAAMADVPGPVLGLTIDAPAGELGALPQGGETVVEFPNNHFGYALTWFGFALLTPALLGFWVWRQLKSPKP
ncbi:MAG: SURF1 family protein [Devosia nanyangense]|uniref:SURF1-like protein n=1 Tax=Devosia nanyangense TaxID=1228055 RepID=A0A933L473_9HYPH|nr:SURF1 family protein [Devosia nanyangense]